ncbi:MAG: CBS domain-containing protein [Myxococcales bacterium]|nr:CBS domain-containing protein [Myxococcales bacterium]
MKIQGIMSSPAITCGQDDHLDTAARCMWEHDCGAVPVVAHDGSLVGIITDRDIAMAAYTQGLPLRQIPVKRAMATQVFTCRADQTLEVAERLMRDKQIRRIPIVDGQNRPIGVLSLNDIVRYAGSPSAKSALDHEVAQVMAAICAPRRTSTASSSRGRSQAQPPPV